MKTLIERVTCDRCGETITQWYYKAGKWHICDKCHEKQRQEETARETDKQ